MAGLPQAAPPGPGRQEDAGWSADARWRRRGAPTRLALTRSGATPRLRYAAGERGSQEGAVAAADYERVDPERASVWVPAPVILVAAAAGERRNVMVAVRLMRWDDPPRASI